MTINKSNPASFRRAIAPLLVGATLTIGLSACTSSGHGGVGSDANNQNNSGSNNNQNSGGNTGNTGTGGIGTGGIGTGGTGTGGTGTGGTGTGGTGTGGYTPDTGVAGPSDPLQALVGGTLNTITTGLPAAQQTPLSSLNSGLLSVLDIVDSAVNLVADLGVAGANPVAATAALGEGSQNIRNNLADTVSALDSALTSLAGGPLAGTPYAESGRLLQNLSDALRNPPVNPNGDPDLTPVTNIVNALALELARLPQLVPEDFQDAPVLGGTLGLISNALLNTAFVLDGVGNLNGTETTVAVSSLVFNLTNDLLTDVIPVSTIDPAQAADIQSRLFNVALDLTNITGPLLIPTLGVLDTALNPVGALLDAIL